MKVCSKCHQEKDESGFYKDKTRYDGFNYWCKECTNPRIAQYYAQNKEALAACQRKWEKDNWDRCLEKSKRYRKNNPDKIRESNLKCKAKNPDKYKSLQRSWVSKNKGKVNMLARKWRSNNPDKTRDWELRKNYKITLDDYNRMAKEQHGACAICGIDKDFPGHGKKLHVDHDHDTGKVRGLLCNGCNVMIARAKEDPDVLRNAIVYLSKHKGVSLESHTQHVDRSEPHM